MGGYKIEDKLYLGVHERKMLNTTALKNTEVYNALAQWLGLSLSNRPNSVGLSHPLT
jgi:hypothetical protein